MSFIVSCLLLSLLVVVFQDLKYRKIHVVLPMLVFVFSVVMFNKKSGLSASVYLTNALFFLIVLAILIAYMSLKNRKIINPFTHYFGLGDLLFYMAVTPLFLTYNYIVFFILSMIFAIVMHLLFKKMQAHETIPLAGFSALLLMLIIIKDLLLTFNKFTLL